MNKLLSAFLLATLSLTAACPGGGGEDEPRSYQCTATISPVSFAYEVLGTDLLQVSANGQTEIYARVGGAAAAELVYGVWNVGTTQNGTIESTLDIRIQPGSVSALADCDFGSVSADAVATAPAEITSTTITILGSDTDTQIVTD